MTCPFNFKQKQVSNCNDACVPTVLPLTNLVVLGQTAWPLVAGAPNAGRFYAWKSAKKETELGRSCAAFQSHSS